MKFMVYGTLKKAYGNHRILVDGNATYLGKAVTLQPMALAGHGVPFVWPSKEGSPLCGEVYDIGDPVTDRKAAQTLGRLDRLESNGYVYERKLHTVRMIENAHGIKPLPRDQGEEHEVWLYEAMPHVSASYDDDECCKPDERGFVEWERVYATVANMD